MRVGWHYLPGNDDPNPPMGAATFLDLDAKQGLRSPYKLCRPYFKGKPGVDEIASAAQSWHNLGCHVQLGNELNLPGEEWPGSAGDYADWYYDIKRHAPQVRLYWAAPSPGIEHWPQWYDRAGDSDGLTVHAYGTFQQMTDTVRLVADRFPRTPIWIAECNFGAGNTVDVTDWAWNHFMPFLFWCTTRPNIEAVTYFAYQWDQSGTLPTSVDGVNTAIEKILRGWVGEAAVNDNMRIYADWALARMANNEEPRDVTAFVTHLKAIGANYKQPHDYGLPYVVVSPKG